MLSQLSELPHEVWCTFVEELLQYWPQVDQARGYPTVTAALEHTAVRGTQCWSVACLALLVRMGGVLVNLSFQQVLEVCQGRDYAPVLPLFAQTCAWKQISKLNLLWKQ